MSSRVRGFIDDPTTVGSNRQSQPSRDLNCFAQFRNRVVCGQTASFLDFAISMPNSLRKRAVIRHNQQKESPSSTVTEPSKVAELSGLGRTQKNTGKGAKCTASAE